MAKDIITGLTFRGDGLEWTAVHRIKGNLEKTGSGRISLGEEGGPMSSEDAAKIAGDVAVCLNSDKALMRVIELPDVEGDELRSMVELQMDKYSPFPIENMVISYEVIDKDDTHCRLLVAAVRKNVIDELGEKLKSIGLSSARIDIDIMGWLRLLRDAGKISQSGRQVVILLNESSNIVVFQDAVPVAVHSLPMDEGMGKEDILIEVARETGYALMSLELASSSASPLKIDVYSSYDVSSDFLDALEGECGCRASTGSLDDLPPLSEGLARRAADEGAKLLDMTPDSWKLAESLRQSRKNMINTVVTLATVWLLSVASFFGYIFLQEKVLSRLKADQALLAEPAGQVRDMVNRVRVIERYMDRSDSALECLLDVSKRMPTEGIELNLFNYKKGEDLVLAGEAAARSIVLSFQENLIKSEIFAKVIPGEIKIISGKHRFSFDLQFPEGAK